MPVLKFFLKNLYKDSTNPIEKCYLCREQKKQTMFKIEKTQKTLTIQVDVKKLVDFWCENTLTPDEVEEYRNSAPVKSFNEAGKNGWQVLTSMLWPPLEKHSQKLKKSLLGLLESFCNETNMQLRCVNGEYSILASGVEYNLLGLNIEGVKPVLANRTVKGWV